MVSNFALPEKKHKIGKKIVFLGIAIVLVFLVYYFLYVYKVDSFRVVMKRPVPLTQDDMKKGYTGKYALVIEHSYGPLVGRKTERIMVGEADFSSEEFAKTFFSNWVEELKSKPILTEHYERKGKSFNFSANINYMGSMIVKGHKVEIFQEIPFNSSFKSYLFVMRNKNKIVEIFSKEYDKKKIGKLVEWFLNK